MQPREISILVLLFFAMQDTLSGKPQLCSTPGGQSAEGRQPRGYIRQLGETPPAPGRSCHFAEFPGIFWGVEEEEILILLHWRHFKVPIPWAGLMLCLTEQDRHSLRVVPQGKISVQDSWDESVLGERTGRPCCRRSVDLSKNLVGSLQSCPIC